MFCDLSWVHQVHQWYSNLFTPLTCFFPPSVTVLLSQISQHAPIFAPSLTHSQPLPPITLFLPTAFLQSLPRKLLAIQFREAAGTITPAPHTAAGLSPTLCLFVWWPDIFTSLCFLFSWNGLPYWPSNQNTKFSTHIPVCMLQFLKLCTVSSYCI